MLGRLLPWWQGKLFVLSCSASWPPTAYLRGWGFSPQKPQRRTLEQNPAEVRRWLAEMGVRSDATAGRSWAPVGQTPVIKGTGKRFRVNMLSAISNAGRLLRDSGGRKVHLIVDGHPVHRAKAASAWVGRHAERIELHFLPGYSPELNPVELLNQDVKANAAGRRRARSAAELTKQLRSYLRRRQRQPEVVARFFTHPNTCYAFQ
jgi:transposase